MDDKERVSVKIKQRRKGTDGEKEKKVVEGRKEERKRNERRVGDG